MNNYGRELQMSLSTSNQATPIKWAQNAAQVPNNNE